MSTTDKIFDKNTYKRLSILNKKKLLHGNELLKYCRSLPPIIFVDPIHIMKLKEPPLNAIQESKFSNFKSIINNMMTFNQDVSIKLKPHKIHIYGNKISEKYIFHVNNIIKWWENIRPKVYEVNLYLTNLKKQLPDITKPLILDEESINSGFTFVNSPNDIHIFRKEESLKVLFHELIHASKYDFDNNNLLNLQIKLKDDNITNEGITEYLAIIHYYWYVANYLNQFVYKNISSSELFLELLGNDFNWQEYQINKIFSYFSMKSSDLLNPDNNFKQKTSVISYFIFKNFLFTENSIQIILSRNYDLINELISRFPDYLKNFQSYPILKNSTSMRMSLYEFDF
jgi:hypothetical protein